jgi:hypothetical protein
MLVPVPIEPVSICRIPLGDLPPHPVLELLVGHDLLELGNSATTRSARAAAIGSVIDAMRTPSGRTCSGLPWVRLPAKPAVASSLRAASPMTPPRVSRRTRPCHDGAPPARSLGVEAAHTRCDVAHLPDSSRGGACGDGRGDEIENGAAAVVAPSRDGELTGRDGTRRWSAHRDVDRCGHCRQIPARHPRRQRSARTLRRRWPPRRRREGG